MGATMASRGGGFQGLAFDYTARSERNEMKPSRSRAYFVHTLLRAKNFQTRPELDAIVDWWRTGGKGVCALIGIGGAGKTAIVDHFVRMLPGVIPPEPDHAKDNSLPRPSRVFVFSFYSAPSPDSFFSELVGWLGDSPTANDPPIPSYERTIRVLGSSEHCLIVLDGLEKVQELGLEGGLLGRISDGRLRDLILRAAEVLADPIVVTSRFCLSDVLAKRSPFFRVVPVEKIDSDAAVALLRARGVRGSSARLAALAREYGLHALTIDLIGGFIAHFCEGDPEKLPPEPQSRLGRNAPADVDPEAYALHEQEEQFTRVALRYVSALRERDAVALWLMQVVCLFRLAVRADDLVKVASRLGGPIGSALDNLPIADVSARLEALVRMHLLDSSGKDAYQVHSGGARRFLNSLDPELGKQAHGIVRAVFGDALPSGLRINDGWNDGIGASVRLLGEPQYSSDGPVLDRLEEIVYHTLQEGRVTEAWSMYLYRLGAYGHVGLALAAYEKGLRICRMIAARDAATAEGADKLSPRQRQNVLHDIALYSLHLGDPIEAASNLEQSARALEALGERVAAAKSMYSEAEAQILAGDLAKAKRLADDAAKLAKDDAPERGQALAYVAHVHALWGDRNSADAIFEDVQRTQDEIDRRHRPLYSHRGVFQSLMKLRLGVVSEAEAISRANLQLLEKIWGPLGRENQESRLVLASAACRKGDWAEARAQLAGASDWAVNRDAKAVLAWSARVKAEILIEEKQAGPSTTSLAEARMSVEDGLRLARRHGYSIHHVDLLNVSSLLYLLEGKPAEAEREARMALTGSPADQGGQPRLLGAIDDECRYVWGKRTARQSGRGGSSPNGETAALAAIGRGPGTGNCGDPDGSREIGAREGRRPAHAHRRSPRGGDAGRAGAVARGTLTNYPLPTSGDEQGAKPEARRFRVALSFSGKENAFIAKVAGKLARTLGKKRVFYYQNFLGELTRFNLDTYLQDLYRQADLIVVFLSAGYEASEFCGLEWRVVRELIKKRRDAQVMPIKFDDTDVPGLFSIDGYLDARKHSPQKIAGYIEERLKSLEEAS